MPITCKATLFPVGAVSWTGDPIVRWCDFANPLSTNAPCAPSFEKTALLPPSSQVMLKIWAPPGPTAVA